MVAELRIDRWCDRHRGEKGEDVAATLVTFDLGSGPREVDVCEVCAEEVLGPVIALFESYGRKPDAGERAAMNAQGGPKRASQEALIPAPTTRYPCVVCDGVLSTPKSLSMHLKREHDLALGEVYGATCPLCDGGEFTNLGVHLGRADHAVRTVVDGFLEAERRGDPYGVVEARRLVWRDLKHNGRG